MDDVSRGEQVLTRATIGAFFASLVSGLAFLLSTSTSAAAYVAACCFFLPH